MPPDISSITPTDITPEQKANAFQYIFQHLVRYRNTCLLYMSLESAKGLHNEQSYSSSFELEINLWAQDLLTKAWAVCTEEDEEKCPKLGTYADTSTAHLPPLPSKEDFDKLLASILFLDIAISKLYSARTRTFLGTLGQLDEKNIAETLKNPERALQQVRERADRTTEHHAQRGKIFRAAGMAIGAAAGGVLIGVTGGLAAPLVGAGVASVLGWLGVGGSAVGLLASGLAGSSVVCGALFGAYGARSTARMVERHVREIKDLDVIPIRQSAVNDTLSVRLCVSGWLGNRADVTAPWTVFGRDSDTFALQWEIQVLEDLSNALMTLVKTQSIQYLKAEVIKRTVLASLMSSLAPLAWLKIGKIIDNPWMNAKALAEKAGAVLGDLLKERAFGNRPVTLTGYSLGSLVIFEALKYLSSLPPNDTLHLIQDVYLFGNPAPADANLWLGIRRLVSGRLVNGYSNNDYILAVLSRISNANWDVAGLQPIKVKDVENVLCEEVEGHTMWRGMIGQCLERCHAPGIVNEQVSLQLKNVAIPMKEEMNRDDKEFDSEHGESPISAKDSLQK